MRPIPLESTDVVTLEAHPRTGVPQAHPTFSDEAVYLHPIPRSLLEAVKPGERWAGRFGRLHRPMSTQGVPKQDARGRPLYERYFIPLRKVDDDAS